MKKVLFHYCQYLLLAWVAMLAISCGNESNSNSTPFKKSAPLHDSLKLLKDSLATVFNSLVDEPGGDSVSNIFKKKNVISSKFLLLDEPSGEVHPGHITIITQPLKSVYKDGINNSIEFPDLAVSFFNVLAATNLLNIKENPDRLIAFYSVLVPDNGSYYSSFVITQAYKANDNGYDTIKPIPNGDNQYLLLVKNNTNGLFINESIFKSYVLNFHSRMEFKGFNIPNPSIYKVRDFHYPLISHHLASEFYLFYNSNKVNFQNESNVLIRIERGFSYIQIYGNTPGTTLNVTCQSPISIFNENNRDLLYGDPKEIEGKPKYYLTGLDVGRLCPPQCD